MLMPSIFENRFMDHFFDDMFRFPLTQTPSPKVSLMNADVKEFDDKYQLDLELPGYKKEDIKVSLKDGYLTIEANHQNQTEEQADGKYIRRERFYGQYQRSFYVGEQITHEDIQATFTNGILQLDIPKKKPVPEVEQNNYITIQG